MGGCRVACAVWPAAGLSEEARFPEIIKRFASAFTHHRNWITERSLCALCDLRVHGY